MAVSQANPYLQVIMQLAQAAAMSSGANKGNAGASAEAGTTSSAAAAQNAPGSSGASSKAAQPNLNQYLGAAGGQGGAAGAGGQQAQAQAAPQQQPVQQAPPPQQQQPPAQAPATQPATIQQANSSNAEPAASAFANTPATYSSQSAPTTATAAPYTEKTGYGYFGNVASGMGDLKTRAMAFLTDQSPEGVARRNGILAQITGAAAKLNPGGFSEGLGNIASQYFQGQNQIGLLNNSAPNGTIQNPQAAAGQPAPAAGQQIQPAPGQPTQATLSQPASNAQPTTATPPPRSLTGGGYFQPNFR